MMKPTVHLNGTSREGLISQYHAAYDAGRTFLETLRAAYPNGRDYYPQGPDALKTAMAEHDYRTARVSSILSDLEELLGALI